MVDFLAPLESGEKSYGGVCGDKVTITNALTTQYTGNIADNKYITETIVIYGWEALHFVRDTINFKEEPVIIDGGEYYHATLTGRVAKDTADRLTKLQQAGSGQWLVIFTDGNGVQKIMGKYRAGAVIKWSSRNNKQQMPDRNEFEVMIEITAMNPVAEYPFEV